MENTTRRSKRLGKGLSALIPEINEEIDKKDIVQIKLSNIRPNKNQPRKEFDEDRIKALSDSIKNVGVLQPIVLKPIEDNNYMIIAGERRNTSNNKRYTYKGYNGNSSYRKFTERRLKFNRRSFSI